MLTANLFKILLLMAASEQNFLSVIRAEKLILSEHKLLFPRGHLDMIDHWISVLDETLVVTLAKTDSEGLKIREKNCPSC